MSEDTEKKAPEGDDEKPAGSDVFDAPALKDSQSAEAREADSGSSDTASADSSEEGDDEESEEGEEEGEGEEEEEEEEAAPAAATKKGKAPAEPMTPGQRLAAAKAAKAARKQSDRGKAPIVPTAYAKKAEAAGSWFKRHQRNAIIGGVAVLVVIGGVWTWSYLRAQSEAAATAELEKAVATPNATIRDEDSQALDDPNALSFPTQQARARRALAQFDKVLAEHGDASAAVWAQLGRARALFDLQRWRDARAGYEAALRRGGEDQVVAWRAIEGIGFTFEAEHKWREALARFEELGRLDNGAYRDIAEYHMSRMYLAQNDKVRAKETLRALIERMRSGATEDSPKLPFVMIQAETRLAELDSSLVPRGAASRGGGPGGGGGIVPGAGGAGGAGGNNITQEQLEELIRRFQQKQGQKAPGGGGGGGGGAGGAGGE